MKGSGLVAASVLTLAFGLTGCETAINQGPLSIRVVEGQFELAVCEAIDVKSVSASWRVASGDWEYFVDAEGQATTRVGSVFDVTFGGELTPAGSEPPTDLVDEISVLIKGDDRNVHGLWSDLQLDPLGTLWRHPDGSDSTEPCEY